jgi:mRNA interferase MazF
MTIVPHTTSVQGTRFEVAVRAKFLQAAGVFDAQQVVTVPQVKLVKRLGYPAAESIGTGRGSGPTLVEVVTTA